jgi:hypothetical protein
LINLGGKIVDNYCVLKKDYDGMMAENKDFRELVVINNKFLMNVMNFEIEAT